MYLGAKLWRRQTISSPSRKDGSDYLPIVHPDPAISAFKIAPSHFHAAVAKENDGEVRRIHGPRSAVFLEGRTRRIIRLLRGREGIRMPSRRIMTELILIGMRWMPKTSSKRSHNHIGDDGLSARARLLQNDSERPYPSICATAP